MLRRCLYVCLSLCLCLSIYLSVSVKLCAYVFVCGFASSCVSGCSVGRCVCVFGWLVCVIVCVVSFECVRVCMFNRLLD